MRVGWSLVAGTILACSAVAFAPGAKADGDADDYRANCFNCHTIGGGRLAGPDLKGIKERIGTPEGPPSDKWVLDWIVDPDAKLDGGDPYATALMARMNGARMSKVSGMTAARAAKLMEFVAAESQKEKSEFAETGVAELPKDPAKLAALIARGRGIMLGTTPLAHGGTACIACHQVGDAGPLGGGRLGPDLMGAVSRLGGIKGLGAWMKAPPTLTMKPLFAVAPLVMDSKNPDADEILPVLAYLQDIENRHAAPDRTTERLTFAFLGIAGAGALLVLFDFAWRRRFKGVRRALVKGQS